MKQRSGLWVAPIVLLLGFQLACMPPTDGIPEAAFSAAPRTGPAPLTVQFTDESTVATTKGAAIETWLWDFGDGMTSEDESPEHVYQNAGDYTVSLTVSVGEMTDTITMDDFIEARDADAPPATPVLTQFPEEPVSAATIQVAGTADPNATIHVTGGDNADLATTANASGEFAVTAALLPNQLNRLFFIAENGAGDRSAPAPLSVVRDGQAPNLFIDLPEDGAELTNETIQVAGRVADMLSGFMGLAVSVNGSAANVHEGIGTNGSFELSGVPLELGENTITATAMDALGNESMASITVTRVALSGPRMSIVSGDGQTATMLDELAAPIVVQVTNEDGSPFANKTVTFRVTRSDGRLAATSGGELLGMMYQTKTDAEGMAQAFWRLGSDAGMGNNRVSVTSADIAGTIAFTASAEPGLPTQINIGSGNNQRTEAGAPATDKLNAWVNDGCNGIAGVPVTFTIVDGDGSLSTGDEKQLTVMTDSTGHAKVTLITGESGGNNIVEADFEGNMALPATFMVMGVERTDGAETTFSGRVLDNANNPIGGAEVLLEINGVAEDHVETDAQGRFTFTGIPAGPAHGHVDGGVATTLNGMEIDPGTFPALPFETTIVANADNTLAMPLFLPELNPANAVTYDGTQDVELTVEGIEGLRMIVKAGSMTRADGSTPSVANPAVLSLNQVAYDDIPMPMPDGVAPAFAWTLQPSESHFDPPIEVIYPNISGLPAGAAAYFLSFDHHTNKFEIVASGHVSEDASEIVSDPGSGIPIAGWGGNCPPYSVTGKVRNCYEVAVAFLEGGPKCPQAFPGLCPEEWSGEDFSAPLYDLAGEIRELDPRRITTRVFPAANSAEAQIFAVEQWLRRLQEPPREDPPISESCSRPYLILVGHSLGGDTVRLAGDLDANVSIIAEGISREFAVDDFPGAAFYQRDLTLDGVSNIINFVAPDTFDAATRANCQNIGFDNFGDVECLLGFRVMNDSVIEVPGTTHASIIESAPFRDRIAMEVADVLDLDLDPKGDSMMTRLDSRFTLFANGQPFPLGNDGLFVIPNITAPDEFGRGGPGTPPDFIADERISVVGIGDVDGESMYLRSEPFFVINGGTKIVNVFSFSNDPPPFPKRLILDAQSVVLNPGAMTQLTTTAVQFDDTLSDVTLVDDGTVYRVSSTDFITVNDQGVLSAVQNGVAIVAASNEGVTVSRRVTIASETIMTTIEGYVFDENGEPVQGATVMTTAFGGEATTNASGFFSLMLELPFTTSFVTLRTMVGETEVDSGLVPVVPGGISDAGLLQPPSTAFSTTVRGTVVLDGGGPVEGASVVTSLGGQGTTDGDGEFSFFIEGAVPGGGLPPMSVTARFVMGELTFLGEVTGITVVPDGITEAGTITVSESISILYPGARFSVSGPPRETATGDLDGDGLDDIVVVTFQSLNSIVTANLASILNRGDGTFAPPMTVSIGSSPSDVQLADLNGDMRLDAVIADAVDNEIQVCLGNGDGSFSEPVAYPVTGMGLGKVAVGDVNNDSMADVVGTTSIDGTVWILLGNGDGTLGDPTSLEVDLTNTIDLALADITGDMNLDLILASRGQSRIEVYVGDGTGAFAVDETYPCGQTPEDLLLRDVNNDGVLDAVVTNFNDTLSVLLGVNDGTFGEVQSTFLDDGNPRGVTAADFNGDGNIDFATANVLLNDSGLSVVLGNGDGTFQESMVIGASRFTTEITALDVDGDEIIDLLPVTGASTGDVVVLRGLGDGTFETQESVLTGEFGNRGSILTDLDGDDNLDIVSARFTNPALLGFLGNGDGTFLEPTSVAIDSRPFTFVMGTINGDANPDVVMTHDNPGRLSVILSNGDGTFQTPMVTATNNVRANLAIGDLDRDGANDIVIAPSENGDFGVLLGVGDGTFQNLFEVPGAASPIDIKIADMDGDGDPDVITAEGGFVRVYLGNGDGSFQTPITGPTGGFLLTVGDLTSDGIPDVVGVDSQNPGVYFAEGQGDGTFGAETFFMVNPEDIGPDVLTIADVTLDGIPDIVYADGFQVLGVLAGDGTGFFTGPTRYDLGGTFPVGLSVGDIDEDGLPDAAVATNGSNSITLLFHR